MDERDILRAHLRELSRLSPPSREEERELAILAQTGDLDARNELVERNARLIGEIINLHYFDLSGDLPAGVLDLIQEGYLGLFAAVDRYDPETGWRFTTYAGSWVRKYISAALSATRTGIDMPDHARRKSRQFLSAEERLMQRLGRQPTIDELAEECGVSAERMAMLRGAAETPLYLDAVLSGGQAIVEMLPGSAVPPDLRAQCREVVQLAETYLPERHLEIVRRYYGLNGPAESFVEIAADLGLSRQRAWEMCRDAVEHLRCLTREG